MKSKTLTVETTIKELDFLKKANIIQWNTGKERFIFARKQINRKNTWPRNDKEDYPSFIRKKNKKSGKQ